MARKYTILLIPEGTNQVKRLWFPRYLLPLILVLVLGSCGLAGFWYNEYQEIRGRLPEMAQLKKQTELQQAQINAFSGRLNLIKDQMTKLKAFNHQLKVLANLEDPQNGEDAIFGVGGPDGLSGGPGLRLASSSRERRLQVMQRDLEHLAAESEAERLVQEELAKFLQERRSILARTPSIWPVRGWVTSGFGRRVDPFNNKRQFHSGIDISTRRGTPVKAPADGVVTFAGRESGFGKLLVVNHGQGLITRYAHLNAFRVKVGDKVKRHQVIGLVGNTGRSTGPHLHYEVLLSGVPTNPKYYILD